MPPRKRARAVSSAETEAKKPKTGAVSKAETKAKKTKAGANTEYLEQPEEKSREEIAGANDLTIRNSTECPLLRLPTELREKIWTYAFGNRTFHPTSDRPYGQPGTGHIKFNRCLEPLHDLEIYDLTKLGASAANAGVWAAEHLRYNREDGYSAHRHGTHAYTLCDNEDFRGKPRKRLLQPVCKQMYYEALPIVWRTTTFCFCDSVAYEDFTRGLCPTARLDMLTHISFVLDYRSPRTGWLNAITPRSVAALSSLRGLSLVLVERYWDPSPCGPKATFMDQLGYRWSFLPNFIRQFRRWKLEEDRTSVFVSDDHNYHPGDPPLPGMPVIPVMSVAGRLQLAEAIKAELLKYEPRRTGSRRR